MWGVLFNLRQALLSPIKAPPPTASVTWRRTPPLTYWTCRSGRMMRLLELPRPVRRSSTNFCHARIRSPSSRPRSCSAWKSTDPEVTRRYRAFCVPLLLKESSLQSWRLGTRCEFTGSTEPVRLRSRRPYGIAAATCEEPFTPRSKPSLPRSTTPTEPRWTSVLS